MEHVQSLALLYGTCLCQGMVLIFFFVIFFILFFFAFQILLKKLFKALFPREFFGRLMGIQRISMGIFSFPVIGLAKVPGIYPENGFTGIFIGCIILSVIVLVFPAHGFYLAIKARKENTQKL